MISLRPSDLGIRPDTSRVIARPFLPGAPAFGDGPSRVRSIVDRIVAIDEDEATELLADARAGFTSRHDDLLEIWESNAAAAFVHAAIDPATVPSHRRALIGAFFTQEYALQAAAVCNPSIVPAPEGDGRVVMSLRAIGEGHISSVEFRTGAVDSGALRLDPPAPHLSAGERRSPLYSRNEFFARLDELRPDRYLAEAIAKRLGSEFTIAELDSAVSAMRDESVSEAALLQTTHLLHWVATSNYEVTFDPAVPLSGRVLVPAGPADSRGIEDVRLVRFVDDDGTIRYLGTYTAFDGRTILPQLIETRDFSTFRLSTLSGSAARNKGMAIFPRRVDGDLVALGRLDRESIFVMRSDRMRVWEKAEQVYPPTAGWESIQVGNCGSPIETEEGWLVITHGVGPMRTYALGAILLDLDRPERLIGRLEQPLLVPDASERDGYVPNVVYSCGALVWEGTLYVPYGFSDWGVAVGTVPVADLLDALKRQ